MYVVHQKNKHRIISRLMNKHYLFVVDRKLLLYHRKARIREFLIKKEIYIF